jgi:hypothetical protein
MNELIKHQSTDDHQPFLLFVFEVAAERNWGAKKRVWLVHARGFTSVVSLSGGGEGLEQVSMPAGQGAAMDSL